MSSSCFLNVIFEQLKLLSPVIYHEITVVVEFCYTLVWFVVVIHHKHVAIRVIDHQYFDKLEELIITVNKTLLFCKFNLGSYIFKPNQGLVKENQAEYQINEGTSWCDMFPECQKYFRKIKVFVLIQTIPLTFLLKILGPVLAHIFSWFVYEIQNSIKSILLFNCF